MKNVLYLMILVMITACRKEATPDCGCDGPSYQTLTNASAVYKAGTIVVIDPNGYFYSPCNLSFVAGKVNAGDTILVSGNVHSNCFKGETLIALPAFLEVTAVRKK